MNEDDIFIICADEVINECMNGEYANEYYDLIDQMEVNLDDENDIIPVEKQIGGTNYESIESENIDDDYSFARIA